MNEPTIRTDAGADHRSAVTVFGGGGLIGSAVVRRFVEKGWQVFAIVRSARSAELVGGIGGTVIRGDLTDPDGWLPVVARSDAVVQVAASFAPDMGDTDTLWASATIDHARNRSKPLRVVYTGGCWLFPASSSQPVTEETAFSPLDAFSFSVRNRAALLDAGVDLVTVHPGMVWSEAGGFLAPFLAALKAGAPIEIPVSPDIRWPAVHVDDLADLYFRAAVMPGISGEDFFGVTDPGLALHEIAESAGRRLRLTPRLRVLPIADFIARDGAWAAGYGRSQTVRTQKAKRMLDWRPTASLRDRGTAATDGAAGR